MYNIGVFPGKFSPPHRGHLNAILQASTQCELLYVVVSFNQCLEEEMYSKCTYKMPTMKQRAKWLSIELSNFNHIKVVMLNEDNIPMYPNGWEEWSKTLKNLIPHNIDVIFGGEEQYADEGYTKYFPQTKYEVYDTNRTEYPICATDIRNNPYKHWEYILGSARPHFVKKVLIIGTESTAKTTLTKMLAKIFNTSWAEEEGRYYSEKYLGKNEDVFELDDFYNITLKQRELEDLAIKNANKIVLLDTDATITQYYCNMYLGEMNPKVETMIDPSRYDLVLYLKPDVKWVDDGLRFSGEQNLRDSLDKELLNMFYDRGFNNIQIINGDYHTRLNKAIEICKGEING